MKGIKLFLSKVFLPIIITVPDFPAITMVDKGKERKKYHYDKMMTPYEKLKSLEPSENYLKEFLSFEQLDKNAYQMSDNKFTDRINLLKSNFRAITLLLYQAGALKRDGMRKV